jgi:hypothetical protein
MAPIRWAVSFGPLYHQPRNRVPVVSALLREDAELFRGDTTNVQSPRQQNFIHLSNETRFQNGRFYQLAHLGAERVRRAVNIHAAVCVVSSGVLAKDNAAFETIHHFLLQGRATMD